MTWVGHCTVAVADSQLGRRCGSATLGSTDPLQPSNRLGHQRVSAACAIDTSSENLRHLLLSRIVVALEMQELALEIGHQQFITDLVSVAVELLLGQTGRSGGAQDAGRQREPGW